jgi:hypothetical protein
LWASLWAQRSSIGSSQGPSRRQTFERPEPQGREEGKETQSKEAQGKEAQGKEAQGQETAPPQTARAVSAL